MEARVRLRRDARPQTGRGILGKIPRHAEGIRDAEDRPGAVGQPLGQPHEHPLSRRHETRAGRAHRRIHRPRRARLPHREPPRAGARRDECARGFRRAVCLFQLLPHRRGGGAHGAAVHVHHRTARRRGRAAARRRLAGEKSAPPVPARRLRARAHRLARRRTARRALHEGRAARARRSVGRRDGRDAFRLRAVGGHDGHRCRERRLRRALRHVARKPEAVQDGGCRAAHRRSAARGSRPTP